MSFLGRWLSSAVMLTASLACAILVMQAPAVTDAYAAALLQVATDASRDVDQRLASARRHYDLASAADARVLQVLAVREPSNAETLALSGKRAAALRAGYERIAAARPLLRPAVAAFDAVIDPGGYKREVLYLALQTFVPAVQLSLAALAYAAVGVLLGSLLAHATLALAGRLAARLVLARRSKAWYVPPR
jgi:hypothetical protein